MKGLSNSVGIYSSILIFAVGTDKNTASIYAVQNFSRIYPSNNLTGYQD
jgi:hypothetical protein